MPLAAAEEGRTATAPLVHLAVEATAALAALIPKAGFSAAAEHRDIPVATVGLMHFPLAAAEQAGPASALPPPVPVVEALALPAPYQVMSRGMGVAVEAHARSTLDTMASRPALAVLEAAATPAW